MVISLPVIKILVDHRFAPFTHIHRMGNDSVVLVVGAELFPEFGEAGLCVQRRSNEWRFELMISEPVGDPLSVGDFESLTDQNLSFR